MLGLPTGDPYNAQKGDKSGRAVAASSAGEATGAQLRKIFSFIAITVDGYCADRDGGLDFQVLDDEFYQFSLEQLDEVDTLLFGRVTYEGMAAYWPTEQARQDNPAIADRMNSIAKIVVSRTLDRADWTNTRLISDKVPQALTEVKLEHGKDIAIFGSSTLTGSLMGMGLLDELRLLVNPVVLGEGQTVFKGIGHRTPLQLLKTRRFKSGGVMHYYRPLAARAS